MYLYVAENCLAQDEHKSHYGHQLFLCVIPFLVFITCIIMMT